MDATKDAHSHSQEAERGNLYASSSSNFNSNSVSMEHTDTDLSHSKVTQPDDRNVHVPSGINYCRPPAVGDMDSRSQSASSGNTYRFHDNPPTMYLYENNSIQMSTNAGHVSAPSSGLSNSGSLRQSANQSRATPTVSAPIIDRYFQGTAQEYLHKHIATIQDYKSIDPVKDVKEKLGPELLEELRELLWGQNDDKDKEFEALSAAREGDERIVVLSLFVAKNHKQLSTMNVERFTVLHLAAETCSAHLCRLLITRGADGAIADVYGDTALHIAARYGRADVVKALATTLTPSDTYHPYFRVPYKSLPQDNVQSYNHDGQTPVHLAAHAAHSPNHRDALEGLVKYARADIDYQRLGDGYTPAHIAIDNDDIDCLETCLRLGADSEVRNYKSETPQQLAFLHGDENPEHPMVKLCQLFGAADYQLLYAKTETVEEMDADAVTTSFRNMDV